MRDEITNRVARLCEKLGIPVLVPEFTLTGKVAGRFRYKGKDVSLNYNMDIAINNQEEFMERTVPHEVAHYARYVRAGWKGDFKDGIKEGKRDIHGERWKAVMRELGVKDISRCHSYKLPESKGRTYKRFSYQCHAGHSYELTAIRHNRILKGTSKYYCRECDSLLEQV